MAQEIEVKKKEPIFEFLESIAEMIPASFYWLDTKGICLGLNTMSALGVGGQCKEDIIGNSVYDAYPKEIADTIQGYIDEVIATGVFTIREDRITDMTTGQVKYFSSARAPLRNEKGKIIGLIGAGIDITANKEAELQKLENEANRAMLAEKEKLIALKEAEQLKYENRRLEEQHKLHQAILEKEAAESERLRLENELRKLENQNLLAEKKSQERVTNFINKMLHEIQAFRIGELHLTTGIRTPITYIGEQVRLTKREQQILYFLSLNKSPKDIAQIITILEDKPVTDSTVNAIINKKLYPKFEVFNIGQLVEKAILLNQIPFLLDDSSA
ncbi:MAG: Sensory box histidine kinase/response regulator [Burkholderiales bacterium]|nr:Sensory box histidine kinase/response regulator [Burkholderiales bacterium]